MLAKRSRHRCDEIFDRAFDPAFYLSSNIDLAVDGVDPADHYRDRGWREGRRPAFWFDTDSIARWQRRILVRDRDPFAWFLQTADLRKLDRDGRLRPSAAPDLPALIAQYFDRDYYLARYRDIERAGVDPLRHYLVRGWRERRRPNLWFDPDGSGPAPDDGVVPFLRYLQETPEPVIRKRASAAIDPGVAKTPAPAASNATDLDLIRSGFDAGFYLDRNPAVAKDGMDPIEHFASVGWSEGRDPSPDFSVSYYLKHNSDIVRAGINPYLHYLKYGRKERWRKVASVAEAGILDLFERDEGMLARIGAAKALDPMVGHPRDARTVTSPLKAARESGACAEALRRAFAGRRFRYVIAVPHVRMSGASRVASIFTRTLATIRDPRDILVITTDGSEAEYADWFPSDVERFDLSAEIEGLPTEWRMRLLLDLLRGIGCETLVNVNSRLVWDTLSDFGRQMSNEMRVMTYLFCWDETPEGDRGGYPIQWLHATYRFHDVLMTDTRFLADDIRARLGFDRAAERTIIRPLHTPVDFPGADDRPVDGSRDAPRIGDDPPPPDDGEAPFGVSARKRILWAGRFDRQKRVDLLVEIARANPQLTFDVYGKAVIDQATLADFDPPENVVAKGAYASLRDVPLRSYAGFLYTAQWDGLPSVLLEIAAEGLPIVAPRIGGIAELVDDETGWLIDDFTDVGAYSRSLAQLVADPADAARRADRMRVRATTAFTFDRYRAAVEEVIDAGAP